MTNFEKKVYRICKKIPKGKVSTYKAIAVAMGHPKAYRAVGQALNKNPFAPEVPCHRVIQSNGQLGGFAFGAKNKIKLLMSEGLKIEKNKVVFFNKHLYIF